MKNLLILDLESTCFENNPPRNFFSEIIEIGAVVFDPNQRRILTEYQCFVKPVIFPILSDFCKQLTKITQEQVDHGIPLAQAMKEIGNLARESRAVFASWGGYDRKQIQRVCQRFRIEYPFRKEHINLKEEHAKFYGVKRMGMAQALQFHGLALEGTHHRGIDDARNIARIVEKMLKDGWEVQMKSP